MYGRRAMGHVFAHGVHGGVAGDCAIGVMLTLVQLNVDGRLSVVCDLEHTILQMAPDCVHGVGVSPHWSWQWHHVVDWHFGCAGVRLAAQGDRQRRLYEGGRLLVG